MDKWKEDRGFCSLRASAIPACPAIFVLVTRDAQYDFDEAWMHSKFF